MATIRDLAQEMSRAFEGAERTNGDKFRKLKDDSPEWMTDVCRAAHQTSNGTMMPDDERYGFIEEAADALAEYEDEDDARDSIEASIYTHELTLWLDSRCDRYGYCDQWMEDTGGTFTTTLDLLQGGQKMEKDEVFNLVLDALRELASDDESEDEDAA